MQKLILGLHGKRRVGKDTAANVLVNDYGFTKIAFADQLREMCSHLWQNHDAFFTFYEFMKDKPMQELAVCNAHSRDNATSHMFLDWCLTQGFSFTEPRTPRWALQYFSDFIKAQSGDDYWILQWLHKVTRCETSVVVPDIRYLSEAIAVRNVPGFIGIIQIFRKTDEPLVLHNTDHEIPNAQIDDWLMNQTTQAIFESCVKLSVDELITKYKRKKNLLSLEQAHHGTPP